MSADSLVVVERFLALNRARNPDPSPELIAAWEAFGRGESVFSLVPRELEAWDHRVVAFVEDGYLIFVHVTGEMAGAALFFTDDDDTLSLLDDTPPEVAAYLRRIRDELVAVRERTCRG